MSAMQLVAKLAPLFPHPLPGAQWIAVEKRRAQCMQKTPAARRRVDEHGRRVA